MKYKKGEDNLIYIKDICIFFCLFIILTIVLFFLVSNNKWLLSRVTIPIEWVQNITSIQTNISLLSITIMELLLAEADTRVLGISYKYIFFKRHIFRGINAISCIMYMLFLMIFSFIGAFLFGSIDAWCLFGKIIVLLSLSITFLLMFHMIFLGLMAKYKKSILFNKVYKKLKKSDKEIYRKIMGNLDINNAGTKVHNEYIREEFILLAYIFLHIGDFESDEQGKRKNLSRINERIKNLIDTDSRSKQSLIKILYDVGEKEFKKCEIIKVLKNCFGKRNLYRMFKLFNC